MIEYKPSKVELLRWRFADWRRRKAEKLRIWFIWHLPRWVAYWSTIRVFSHGTTGAYGNTHPDELGYGELMKRWEHGRS